MHPVELPSPIHIKPHSQPTSSMPHTHTAILHIPIHIHILMYKTKEMRAVNKINKIL